MKKTTISKRIAANIKLARVSADMTQMDVAKKLSIHYQQVGKVESGRSAIRVDTLLAYAKVLNKTAAELLAGCE